MKLEDKYLLFIQTSLISVSPAVWESSCPWLLWTLSCVQSSQRSTTCLSSVWSSSTCWPGWTSSSHRSDLLFFHIQLEMGCRAVVEPRLLDDDWLIDLWPSKILRGAHERHTNRRTTGACAVQCGEYLGVVLLSGSVIGSDIFLMTIQYGYTNAKYRYFFTEIIKANLMFWSATIAEVACLVH